MKKITFVILLFFTAQLLTAQDKKVKNVNDIEVKGQDIPFSIIENPPVFPGCSGTNQEKKLCLNKSIQKHIVRNFNIQSIDTLGLKPGLKKIYVQFKINKKGEIDIEGARGPSKSAEDEGIRVIKLLPKMIPGKQRGRNINVKYMLPITFRME